MKNKLRTNKGFTLIELAVAVGLLALMISFGGVVIKISIETHRRAVAYAEILQKFRAITHQINNDLKDIRKDAPLLIWFRLDEYAEDRDTGQMRSLDPNERFDQMMFFTTGDFHSTRLYNMHPTALPAVPSSCIPSGNPVDEQSIRGNAARIYYGQAQVYSERDSDYLPPWGQNAEYTDVVREDVFYAGRRILARRRHILTADPRLLQWPDFTDRASPRLDYVLNDSLEHDKLSLSDWMAADASMWYGLITDIFWNNWDDSLTLENRRPHIDLTNPTTTCQTFHNILSEGVRDFQIQWSYWNPLREYNGNERGKIRWFPSDRSHGLNSSHFERMRQTYPVIHPTLTAPWRFGVYFNLPDSTSRPFWYPPEEVPVRYYSGMEGEFSEDFFPSALKFTFTLYDTNGVFEDGIRFTHIVYLDE
ncbi:type II secretion system protein J [Planctomycetota bacterium]